MIWDKIKTPILDFHSYEWNEMHHYFCFYNSEGHEIGRYYPDDEVNKVEVKQNADRITAK